MTRAIGRHRFGIENYACSHPERPYDGTYVHDFGCYACWLHAKTTVRSGDDPVQPTIECYGGRLVHDLRISECLKLTAELHGMAL